MSSWAASNNLGSTRHLSLLVIPSLRRTMLDYHKLEVFHQQVSQGYLKTALFEITGFLNSRVNPNTFHNMYSHNLIS
jgi:hypothetical protein